MLSNYREDLKKHDTGTPLTLFGMVFHVRRSNHNWSKALIDVKRDKFGVFYSESELDFEKQSWAVGAAVAQYLVAKWENVIVDESGETLEWNPGNAMAVFTNPEYFSLVNEILLYANNKENYLYEQLEKDVSLVKK